MAKGNKVRKKIIEVKYEKNKESIIIPISIIITTILIAGSIILTFTVFK
jgi:hypothetical protein